MKKDKFPVKLRQKKIKDGFSLYLEFNANGKTEKKYLGLHLLHGATAKVKAYNANILEQAKAEQAKACMIVTAKMEKGIAKAKKLTLSALCAEYLEEKKRTGKAKGTIGNIERMTKRVIDFCDNKKVYLSNVDVKFCEDFVTYLRNTKMFPAYPQMKKFKRYTNEPLSASTQKNTYLNFASMLRFAVRKGYMNVSPTERLNEDYKIKAKQAERGYLDIEEIKAFESANCRNEETKRAFLFSCYCGLRFSDIKSLNKEEVKFANGAYHIEKKMQKTGELINIPLNQKALQYLGKAKSNGKYFNLPTPQTVNESLSTLAKHANIQKHVTFHVARHTFATTLLTLGGDIYTTSKLLGHKSVTTTQIYADIINKKKEEAVNLFDTI